MAGISREGIDYYFYLIIINIYIFLIIYLFISPPLLLLLPPFAFLKRSLVSCLVEISDVPEDKFSKVCLESVCELALRNPHIVAVSGGVKSLTKTALSAHSRRMIEAIVLSLMYIIGDDATRRFVRVDLDIDVLLGPFTDEFFTHSVVDKPTTHDTEQRLFASRVAIVTMLRTWPGIIYLSSSPHRLKAVIEVLRLAKREYRIAAMDLLFEALHLDTPELSDKFDTVLASRTPGGKTNSISMFDESGVLPRAGGRINLLPKYKAVLLLCLVRAGLVEVCTCVFIYIYISIYEYMNRQNI